MLVQHLEACLDELEWVLGSLREMRDREAASEDRGSHNRQLLEELLFARTQALITAMNPLVRCANDLMRPSPVCETRMLMMERSLAVIA